MGIFGPNYENTGVGIPKNAPKKKGAARFFELFFRKFWKLIQVNILYFVFFIPLIVAVYAYFKVSNVNISAIVVVTCVVLFLAVIGPATVGMMKILRNYTLEKNAFIFTEFKKTFSENYKKSLLMGIIDIIVSIILCIAFKVYPMLAKVYGQGIMVLFAICVSVGVLFVMMNFYTFLMIATTDLSLKNIIKNSIALAFVALKKNVLTLLFSLLVAAVYIGLIIWNFSMIYFIPFVPASIIAFIICFNSYPVIQKYVINPYYEKNGEVNPELDDDISDLQNNDVLFVDRGGAEKPVKKNKKEKKSKGKIIS